MAACENFMESPLVLWVETFQSKSLDYQELIDGVFLCDVMQQIDQRQAYQNINRVVEDVDVRLHNWDILIKNIRVYYVEVLQQLLIMKLPNIQAICREPEKDICHTELKKALLLVLGCAVQCERKEYFIDAIKQLEVDVQHAIVDHIKEVTDDTECILPIEPSEQLETYTEKMFNHLTRLIRERDDYAEVVSDLSQEKDYYQAQSQGKEVPVTPPSTTPDKHHMVVELADSKARVRKLRQELEDKQEVLSDLRDEMEEQKALVAKLRNENLELIQDARSARSLRDELDVLREKVGRADTFQSEITKYKEKLNELEFYKARVDELREDNAILIENKNMLEEQLGNSHKRVETVIELEKELVRYRKQVEEMSQERDSDREKIQILTEENAQLQFEKKSSMNESTNLEQELESARLRISGIGGTLSDQLTETTNGKILRLELENQRLRQKVDEMKENSLIENTALNLELKKENQRLAKKVEKLQVTSREDSQRSIEAEQKLQELMHERGKLAHALDTIKENAERQVKELERENEHLTQTVEVIRERNEKTNDVRLKDLEKENKRMHETVSAKNQLLSKLEFEVKQLKKCDKELKQNEDRVMELEKESASMEKENSELSKTVSALQLTCENFEKENSDMKVESRKLQRTVNSLQSVLQKKEQLEEDHINLKVENQKLQRSLESFKNSTSKMAELESEKDLLNREIQHLKRSLDVEKSQKTKHEQMELDLLDLDNENQKIQRSLDITTKRLQQLEKDNSDLENENEKLQKVIEEMKVSSKRLQTLEKDSSDLEAEITKLTKDKSIAEKENKRLKQSVALKESSYDDLSSKYSALDREHKNLKKTLEHQRGFSGRVRELEKENRELLQHSSMDKKTVADLRENLLNEKIKSQDLQNEMDKLTEELQRVGINKEKLVMASNTKDESRYKALENMMEEALKKSMEIKEEKIHALESRLEESKNRNIKLQEELRMLKRECESLKQRYEEESCGRENERMQKSSTAPLYQRQNQNQNPTKDIFALKDHLIQVERANATLQTENHNLKSQTNSLNEQIRKLENLNSKLQSESSQFRGQSGALQSQNAKLQVDNSTLQSKCSSLLTQTASLQGQVQNLESEREQLLHANEELHSSHEQLVNDHEELQKLHEQLASDYEALISEHGSLKSNYKSVQKENKDLQDRLNLFLQGRDDINHMRHRLEREKDQFLSEQKSLGNLQMDYNRLREEHERTLGQHEKLRKDHHDLSADHKRTKTELNNLQQKNQDLLNECNDNKDQLHGMEIELVSLGQKYDALYQVNQKLDEDNKNLLMQIQTLLNTNQELLTQILESKDTYSMEEKSYLEKLNDLRRQKERLEEKIMEHYKRSEVQKKNKGLGARIARKAAKIFISKNQRSKSKTNLAENSLDNTSQGSDDHDTSKKSEKRYDGRRGSDGDLLEPAIAKQNKSLAKSTSALNYYKDTNGSTVPGSSFRGAKSSEDLLGDTAGQTSYTAGEKESFSSNNSTYFLPGLNRATFDDDDGGFAGNKSHGINSPGDEMLTLEQFLMEVDKSPGNKTSEKQEDTESKSSENSDNSANRRLQQQKRHAPPPAGSHNSFTHQPNRRPTSSIPDVAAVSGLHSDLNVSRMSRISTGSSGSGSYEQATPPKREHPETSTPAQPSNNSQFKKRSYEDLNSFSPFIKYQNEQPHDFRKNTLSSTPSSASRTLQYSYATSPHNDTSHSIGPKSPQNRELPPTPVDKERDNPNLNPAERLDRLMMGFSNSPHNNSNSSSPRVNSNMNSSMNSSDRDSANYDMSVRSGPTSQNYDPAIRSNQQHPLRNMNSESPSEQQRTGYPIYGRPHSSLGHPKVQPSSPSQNGPSGLPPSGSNERSFTGARLGPRPYSSVNNTTRPVSAAYDSNSSPQQGYSNSDNRNSMERVRQSPNNVQHNGPVRNDGGHSARVQRIERPKSVPPNMFNPPPEHQEQQTNSNYSQPYHHGGANPPVAPPRRMRDAPVTNRISLIRQPGQQQQQTPANRPMTSGSPQGNYHSTGGSGGGGGRQLPQGGLTRSQTPTGRIGAPVKPVQNTPPAPKPMNEEPKDPKDNSVWNAMW